jgi:hypothetical protein
LAMSGERCRPVNPRVTISDVLLKVPLQNTYR